MTSAVRAAPKLVLVRHGQASLGSDDYDRLSERGHHQAERVARRLRGLAMPDIVVWSGTLRRHDQTLAPLLAETGIEVQRSEDLNEFSTLGLVRAGLEHARRRSLSVPSRQQLTDPATHLEALLDWFPQVMAAWQRDEFEDPAVGSWSAFRQRVLRPVAEWTESLRAGRSVVVVSSAGVIATVAAALGRRDLAWQRELAVSLYNASFSELTFVGDRWELVSCNCTKHIERDDLQTLA